MDNTQKSEDTQKVVLIIERCRNLSPAEIEGRICLQQSLETRNVMVDFVDDRVFPARKLEYYRGIAEKDPSVDFICVINAGLPPRTESSPNSAANLVDKLLIEGTNFCVLTPNLDVFNTTQKLPAWVVPECHADSYMDLAANVRTDGVDAVFDSCVIGNAEMEKRAGYSRRVATTTARVSKRPMQTYPGQVPSGEACSLVLGGK